MVDRLQDKRKICSVQKILPMEIRFHGCTSGTMVPLGRHPLVSCVQSHNFYKSGIQYDSTFLTAQLFYVYYFIVTYAM